MTPLAIEDETRIAPADAKKFRHSLYAAAVRRMQKMSAESTRTSESLVLKIPDMYQSVKELNDTMGQIRELMEGPLSDSEGILRPTQHALDRVSGLLMEACNAFIYSGHNSTAVFPKAVVSPDLEGGLRIEWEMRQGIVSIVIPPSKGGGVVEYLCKREIGVSKVMKNLSGRLIASWLKRLS